MAWLVFAEVADLTHSLNGAHRLAFPWHLKTFNHLKTLRNREIDEKSQFLLKQGQRAPLTFFFFKKQLFNYSFLAVLGLHCRTGFSPVTVTRGYSLVAMCGLLICGLSFFFFNFILFLNFT